MPSEAEKWQKRFDRERSARKQAEELLEQKSSELFIANEKLEEQIQIKSSELLNEEKKFASLFHYSIDGIILFTDSGIIVDVNQTISDIIQLLPIQVIGKHINTIIPRKHLSLVNKSIQEVLRHGYTRFEMPFQRPGDTVRTAEISASKFEISDHTIIQAIVRDVTERNETANKLQEATTSAIRANEAKSMFLATMSHEIRTPLNGILGFTDLLLEENTNSEQRQNLELIKKSGDLLLNIINDILDFSRVENHHIELEEVDYNLRECIEETLEMHAQSAALKHVELLYRIDSEVPLNLHGDVGRLKQILLNLVSNGLKFTHEGSVIIKVSCPTESHLEFKICDTGIGFSPDLTKQLFQPFIQADASTTRKYGGTGLGLAICKKLSEAMGGSIAANSSPGEGAEFIVTLPFSLAHHDLDATGTAFSQLTVDKTLRVLVVDDHPINLEYMRIRLEKWGCHVTTCISPKDTIKMSGDELANFDVILTDMLMPDINGLMLAEMLKKALGTNTPPLILVTSARNSSDKQKATGIGFDSVLYKPVKEVELRNAILRALNKAEHQPFKLSSRTETQDIKFCYALVVEDNAINAKLAKLLLERMGVTTHIAHNGEEALAALNSKQIYSIVFMDMQMPVMDGLEASKHIRNGKAGSYYTSVPIIAMTANALAGDKQKCLDAGMDNYLPKPIKADALHNMIMMYTTAQAQR
jgi:two-component system sensor histidine kinase/response regulator